MTISTALSLERLAASLAGSPVSLTCPRSFSPAAPISLRPQILIYSQECRFAQIFFFFSPIESQCSFHSSLHSSSVVKPPDYGFLVKIRNPKWTVTRILRLFAFDIHFGGNRDRNLSRRISSENLIFL